MNSNSKPRPVPRPTPITQPFWDGAREGRLMIQYDPEAESYQFWPRAASVRTGKRNLEWRAVSGQGSLYSYTVTHVPTPGFEDRVPYLVGLIELDEGVRIIANLVNMTEDDAEIGMAVKVAWETLSDDIDYFVFEPAAG